CIAGGSVMSRITTRQLHGQLRRRRRTRRRGLADPAQVRDIVAVAVCSHLVPFLGDLPAALGRAEALAFRHTFGTLLNANGENPKVGARTQELLRRYSQAQSATNSVRNCA